MVVVGSELETSTLSTNALYSHASDHVVSAYRVTPVVTLPAEEFCLVPPVRNSIPGDPEKLSIHSEFSTFKVPYLIYEHLHSVGTYR